jgi:hypothetical protein
MNREEAIIHAVQNPGVGIKIVGTNYVFKYDNGILRYAKLEYPNEWFTFVNLLLLFKNSEYIIHKSKLEHKQFCECWNHVWTHRRDLRFYDKISDATFDQRGNPDGPQYDHYRPILREDWPDWAKEQYETLEDN